MRGFSLLEVLAATVIFVVGALAIMWALNTIFYNSADAENTTTAVHLAQKKMEEIRNLDYASIADEAKAAVSSFSQFQTEVIVTEPEVDLKQVEVNTYWMHKGDEINVSLLTYISNN